MVMLEASEKNGSLLPGKEDRDSSLESQKDFFSSLPQEIHKHMLTFFSCANDLRSVVFLNSYYKKIVYDSNSYCSYFNEKLDFLQRDYQNIKEKIDILNQLREGSGTIHGGFYILPSPFRKDYDKLSLGDVQYFDDKNILILLWNRYFSPKEAEESLIKISREMFDTITIETKKRIKKGTFYEFSQLEEVEAEIRKQNIPYQRFIYALASKMLKELYCEDLFIMDDQAYQSYPIYLRIKMNVGKDIGFLSKAKGIHLLKKEESNNFLSMDIAVQNIHALIDSYQQLLKPNGPQPTQ